MVRKLRGDGKKWKKRGGEGTPVICFQRLILPALLPFNLSVLALAVFGFNDLISQSEYMKTASTVLV